VKGEIKCHSSKYNQQGAVLVILVLLMVLAVSTALLTGISTNKTKLARSEKTLRHLASTKSALIAYARLSDPDQTASGLQQRYLPCPDTDGDGLEETPCGTTSATGWLPWQTLGLPPYKDASGYCFRYYVAGAYKQGTSTPPLISALPPAEFLVVRPPDIFITNDVVAIIFAPNTPVIGQTRGVAPGVATECGSTSPGASINQGQNLLESINGISNASAPDFMVAPEGSSSTFNDIAIWISRTEL
jgi:type II secretory pathway pseudopilin PulG